ncbi:MAG: ABC transporter substrate-binding protein [Thermodesulfobacteriota bacterium]|nr:ABC transporter substrate-binding protein [Thermodesulfobacteriota bacterium]
MERTDLMKLLFAVCISLIIFILPNVLTWGADVPGVTSNTVKFGGMGDLTGMAAEVWVPAAEAIRTQIRQINDTGGIHERKIKFILENDHYSIPRALSAFKKLVFRDKVFAVQGASGMGHTHAIIPLAEKAGIPMIAVTNDNRYFEPVRKYLFSPLPFYEDQIKLIFEYIWGDLKAENPIIGFASPDVGAGKICRDLVRNEASMHNLKEVHEAMFPVGSSDCTTEVMRFKKQKPDFIIIYGAPATTSPFLRDSLKLGLSTTFIALQYSCVEPTIQIARKATQNMIGVNCFSSWDEESPGMKKIRKITYQYSPRSTRRDRNYINGWILGFLIREGLKNAGRDLDREAFLRGLEGINNFDTQGICGTVSFGPDDHKLIDDNRFYKADPDNMRLIPITGWRRPKSH